MSPPSGPLFRFTLRGPAGESPGELMDGLPPAAAAHIERHQNTDHDPQAPGTGPKTALPDRVRPQPRRRGWRPQPRCTLTRRAGRPGGARHRTRQRQLSTTVGRHLPTCEDREPGRAPDAQRRLVRDSLARRAGVLYRQRWRPRGGRGHHRNAAGVVGKTGQASGDPPFALYRPDGSDARHQLPLPPCQKYR